MDTDRAIKTLSTVALSLHCWQGDDVGGFENTGELTGGIAATGNYPGKARTPDELRRDLDMVYSLLPGQHRLNLHAFYAETGGRKVERNELQPGAFRQLARLGEGTTITGWISTRPVSRIPKRRVVLRWPVMTTAFATSGSSTVSLRERSARTSDVNWVTRA